MLAVTAAVSLSAAVPIALAQQEQMPLRGDLRTEPAGDLLLRPATSAQPAQPEQEQADGGYQPFSEGAISSGEPLAGEEPEGTDAFAAGPDEAEIETPSQTGPSLRTGPENSMAAVGLRGSIDGDVAELGRRTVPLAAIDAADLARALRIGSDASRVNAIETMRRATPDNPFAPVGLRTGTFVFLPTLEQGIGWTSNAHGAADGESSVYSETTAAFDLRSDWSRHQAVLNGFGTLRRDLSGAEIRDREAGLDGDLRLDLAGGYEGRAALSYLHRLESAFSPVALTSGASRPYRDTLAGEVGIAREVARLRLGLAGSLVRDQYSDAELPDGTVLSQEDRNTTLASLRLRTGYELSPALIPFAEVEIGRRFYDNRIDAGGYARSADRFALRGGVAIDIGDKWSGEVYAGWLSERADDDNLAEVAGLELGGNLAWSPLRGTIVALHALTSVEAATTECDCGALLYAANLSVTQDILSNLTGSAGIGLDYRDYAQSSAYDLTWSGQVALTYWFNRYLGLTGRGRYERLTSSDAGRGSDTASVFVGLRAQR